MKEQNQLVILTPTYNRCKLLPKLYDSLKGQSDMNFLWLIVDDGSTDDTKEYVEKLIKENSINIKYIYQENGGKGRALNNGFSSYKDASAFAVVDSDDHLLPDAVKIIRDYIKKYSSRSDIGAFFFHYVYENGTIIKQKGRLIESDQVMSRYEYNNKFKLNDGCICYLGSAIKEYRYPEYPGENYVGPTVIQMEMANRYKIVFSTKVVGVAEYLESGLTRSGRKMRLRNPKGMIHYSFLMMDKKASLLTRIKYSIAIWPYIKIAKTPFREVVKKKWGLIFSLLPGYLLYLKWVKDN